MGNLRFSHRILLIPTIAAVAFAAIFALNLTLGFRNSSMVHQVRDVYAPGVELTRSLVVLLKETQRTLEYAVGAESTVALAEADEFSRRFRATLDDALRNPAFERREIEELVVSYGRYYQLAHSASLRMINQVVGEELSSDLATMTSDYNAIEEKIKAISAQQMSAMDEAFEAVVRSQRQANFQTGTVIAICFSLMIAVAWISVRSLTRPIAEAVRVASKVAMGDVSETTVVKSNDEIGELLSAMNGTIAYLQEMAGVADRIAQGDLTVEVKPRTSTDVLGIAFETMTRRLQEVIGHIRETSRNLAASSEEMSASSVQIKDGAEGQSVKSEDLSATMVEIAAQIESVSESAQSVASHVGEASASVEQIGASIDRISDDAASMASGIDENGSIIEEMTASIQSISSRTGDVSEASSKAEASTREGGERLSKTIVDIGRRGEEIGLIVDVIEEIVDQTKLLALNAAIEAARAGEEGKGFAVVAEEVRRLAERSMKSTGEIGEFVRSVQSDTKAATDLTESILTEIVDSVANTRTLVEEVHLATKEQSEGSNQLLSRSEDMKSTSDGLARSARELAKGAEQIVMAVSSVSDMTTQVAQSTAEQKTAGDRVVRLVDEIATVARQNSGGTEQLSIGVSDMAREAERLRSLADEFTT